MTTSVTTCNICREKIETNDPECKIEIRASSPKSWLRRDQLEFHMRDVCAVCAKRIYDYIQFLMNDYPRKKPGTKLWFGTNGVELTPDDQVNIITRTKEEMELEELIPRRYFSV